MTPHPWTNDRIRERLEEIGIPDVDRVVTAIRPALRMQFLEGEVALGASHLGGPADVPPDFEWPTRNGVPMSLLAQFDLAAIGCDRLPCEGWLLFFYDADEQIWGFDPKDREGFTVRWIEAELGDLVRTLPEGLPEAGVFGSVGVEFHSTPCLPGLEDEVLDEDADPEADDEEDDDEEDDEWLEHAEVYEELLDDIADSFEHVQDGFFLFGHPQIIQNPMRTECHLASHGVHVGYPEGYETDEAQRLLEDDVDDWNLLLQLDSDEDEPGFVWGDTGRLYFWIRDADLAARRFDRAWCILQCY